MKNKIVVSSILLSLIPYVAYAKDEMNLSNVLISFAPMLIIFAIFYFLLIRPQVKKQQEQLDMVASLKKDDKVIFAGGLMGKIARVEDNKFLIEIAEDTKIEVIKSAVSEKVVFTEENKTHNDKKPSNKPKNKKTQE